MFNSLYHDTKTRIAVYVSGFGIAIVSWHQLIYQTSENSLAIIYCDLQRELSQQEYIDQLTSIFGDKTPSKTTIYHWFSDFSRGCLLLTDKFKEVVQKRLF